jgi:hypothetical protein
MLGTAGIGTVNSPCGVEIRSGGWIPDPEKSIGRAFQALLNGVKTVYGPPSDLRTVPGG